MINDFRVEQYIKVDGGIENNNKAVDDYINSEEVSVQKLIAGKDIKFSNSIVEAQNKIIKYRYLFKHDFKDIHELNKSWKPNVSDYNKMSKNHVKYVKTCFRPV